MTFHYSQPFEKLLEGKDTADNRSLTRARVVIVGSGYGGSIAALRLANERDPDCPLPHDVIVLERGREYALGEFPNSMEELPLHLQFRDSDTGEGDGRQDALFDIRAGENVFALVGSGLGGTSLINANVAMRPDLDIFSRASWPRELHGEPARSDLVDAMSAAESWLGANTKVPTQDFPKFASLQRFAKALNIEAVPAPLAVTFADGTNAAGIDQKKCTGCGNCVTGCNVGAKNTLAMNVIPAAEKCGAEFFTGAIVYAIKPVAAPDGLTRWHVYIKPTNVLTRARLAGPLHIEADIVILSAGTFGSTEILLRSQALGYIKCSEKLGQHFSTNGDGISMSFGERTRVNAAGDSNYDEPVAPAGPTITAIARHRQSLFRPTPDYTLEEGAIPAPLLEFIGELVTTGAQIGRIGWNKLPAWFAANGDPDEIAVHREALDHSQVFLIMSNDDARGSLEFRGNPGKENGGGGIVPTWPKTEGARRDEVNEVLREVNNKLGKHDRGKGLDGGQYVNNPLWQTFANGAEQMQGKLPGGTLLTVHPLGGCRMGNDARDGVVNHLGEVFKGGGSSTWAGLHVLDGSIIPEALGHNPFLTISALAWRASGRITGASEKSGVRARQPLRIGKPPPPANPANEQIVVREQLIGQLEAKDPEQRASIHLQLPMIDRWFEHEGFILRVETDPASTREALLGVGKAKVNLKAFLNPDSEAQSKSWHTYGVKASRLKQPIATGTGTLTLMQPMPPTEVNGDRLKERRTRAIDAYTERRENKFWYGILRRCPLVRNKKPTSIPLLKQARAYLAAAEMQCTYRRFEYSLELKCASETISITGSKIIKWGKLDNSPPLWEAITHVDLTLDFKKAGVQATTRAYVDMDYVMGDGLLTVAPGANVPRASFNCLAYAARLGRGILQSSFWEFGAPQYPARRMASRPQPPQAIGPYPLAETVELKVKARLESVSSKKQEYSLEMRRYGSGGGKGPVLLIHGLAQGSLIYAHKNLRHGMALYLLEQGYEVWLLDYRLSALFDRDEIPFDGWAIDEIGSIDIPAAVRTVQERTGRRVHVYAHCVGAVGISIAILKGLLTRQHLESVAMNAIHPWVMASPFNGVRARLGVAFRDVIDDKYLDPIIQGRNDVDSTQTLLDRVGYSVARLGEGTRGVDKHSLDESDLFNGICDRMTFLYGRMWRHVNVKDIHSSWADLVGAAPGAVYRHLHQMLLRERLVDREGNDVYLTPDNIQHWSGIRTFFTHGDASLVFNPQSATRSAIGLKSHLPDTPVRLRRVPEFGHMDVILGDDAANQCFPWLDHFFRGDFDHSNSHTLPDGRVLEMDDPRKAGDPVLTDRCREPKKFGDCRPNCGPILRGARIDEHGKLKLRHWLVMPPDLPNGTVAEDYLRPRPASVRKFTPAELPDTHQWIDAEYDDWGRSDSWKSWIDRLPDVGKAGQDCHFVVASCWYPGMPFDREKHDQSFAGIKSLLDSNNPCDALFLLGDQIYADSTGGLFDPTAWIDRYVSRYRDAFNGTNAHGVLARIPTHFTLDDHEIANDFAGPIPDASELSGRMPATERIERMSEGNIDQTQLRTAKSWARAFMEAGRGEEKFGNSTARNGELWYELDSREFSCPAFVMDTRSGRQRAASTRQQALMFGGNAMPGESPQLDDLLAWLTRIKDDDRPKFIFTGSVIAPLETRGLYPEKQEGNKPDIWRQRPGTWMREDGFAGYPRELGIIIRHIVDHAIERVVFVAGDLHLSAVASLTLRHSGKTQGVSALQIVASALYAPMSFINTGMEDITWREPATIRAQDYAIDYVPTPLTDAPAHFVKVEAKRTQEGWAISATPYGPAGKPLCDAVVNML